MNCNIIVSGTSNTIGWKLGVASGWVWPNPSLTGLKVWPAQTQSEFTLRNPNLNLPRWVGFGQTGSIYEIPNHTQVCILKPYPSNPPHYGGVGIPLVLALFAIPGWNLIIILLVIISIKKILLVIIKSLIIICTCTVFLSLRSFHSLKY